MVPAFGSGSGTLLEEARHLERAMGPDFTLLWFATDASSRCFNEDSGRRFTRLTNGFSKKWENHWAAVALWFGFYNFVRVHKSLRITPAMAAGITDHVWTVRELLEAA